MKPETWGDWAPDWALSLPLIVATALIHVAGLGGIQMVVDWLIRKFSQLGVTRPPFAAVVAATVLLATVLHSVGGAIWALAYLWLGAVADARTAMLYSLSAMTSYGHAPVFLEERWRMMGALESLNGMLLFGLTTAFMYGVIRKLR